MRHGRKPKRQKGAPLICLATEKSIRQLMRFALTLTAEKTTRASG
jgi:hypothetical protein